MSLGKLVRCLLCVIVLLVPAADSLSQTADGASTGFADPSDTRGLLEYRLPDWGYRTWDLGFDLNGAGADRFTGNDRQYSNSFSTNLDTDFLLYGESERRIRNLEVSAGGNYGRFHNGNSVTENSARALSGRVAASGGWNEYLHESSFSLGGAAGASQDYDERIVENRNDGGADEDRNFGRRGTYSLSAGIGWGRVRDVTPLIRAQRLSERLTALGRPRLTMAQIQEVARVLAREQGYRTVLDRPERSFWSDVLAPMLDPEQPLSPYEVFYLRDVLSENIGPRREGYSVTAAFGYGHRRENREVDYVTNDRGPVLGLTWVRNPSLNHQLALGVAGSYRTVNYTVDYPAIADNSLREDLLRGELGIEHLWTLADRYRLDTSLGFTGRYIEMEQDDQRSIRRTLDTRLGSTFRMFVEDNLSVVASIRGTNSQDYYEVSGGPQPDLDGERYRRDWNWSYGLGFEYYLDRFLY
jgi:hypothetical protein